MGVPRFQKVDDAGTYLDFPVEALPAIPSDDFTDDVPSYLAETVHSRTGMAIAVYVDQERRLWRMFMKGISKATVEYFKDWWRRRVFIYFPDKDIPATYFVVRWQDPEFLPEKLPGLNYNLDLTLREFSEAT